MYILQSPYNSDPNYDYGTFTKLQNKMLLSQLNLTAFAVTFKQIGTFAFGDYSDPQTLKTLVLVTSDFADVCEGINQWPLTKENLIKLGIVRDPSKTSAADVQPPTQSTPMPSSTNPTDSLLPDEEQQEQLLRPME